MLDTRAGFGAGVAYAAAETELDKGLTDTA